MSRIYWDTMLFAYLLEDNPAHAARVRQIIGCMEKRRDTLCTSVLTIGELLVVPYKRGSTEVAQQIRYYLQPPTVEILPFTVETAERFARIRGEHRVTPADAIHLASAAQAGVDLFLTNDRKLQALVVLGIDFIAGMDVNLF